MELRGFDGGRRKKVRFDALRGLIHSERIFLEFQAYVLVA